MELKGIIQEKTDNSVKVNNFWIKFFNKELLDGLNSGDEVSLKYKDNSKDGKVYHNGIEIKKLTFNKVKLDTTQWNQRFYRFHHRRLKQ